MRSVIQICSLTFALLNGAYAQSQHPPGRLPDPRYRPVLGVWEVDLIASKVAKASGHHLRGAIEVADDLPGPARITGEIAAGRILVRKMDLGRIPANSWAFILGHDFAHQTHNISGKDQESEQRADIIGARFARAAGFDLQEHLRWMFHQVDHWSPVHGSFHDRARHLARHFGL